MENQEVPVIIKMLGWAFIPWAMAIYYIVKIILLSPAIVIHLATPKQVPAAQPSISDEEYLKAYYKSKGEQK